MNFFRRINLKQRIILIVFFGIFSVTATLAFQIVSISNQVSQNTASMLLDVANDNRINKIAVLFKKEVQAWKDLLLRGEDPLNNKKYSDEVDETSNKIEAETYTLERELSPENGVLAGSFLIEQKKLTDEYHLARKDRKRLIIPL